jgi:hypothetical protein
VNPFLCLLGQQRFLSPASSSSDTLTTVSGKIASNEFGCETEKEQALKRERNREAARKHRILLAPVLRSALSCFYIIIEIVSTNMPNNQDTKACTCVHHLDKMELEDCFVAGLLLRNQSK